MFFAHRSLVQLREELVEEKLSRDRLSTELESLKRQLGRLGVDWEAVLEGGDGGAASVSALSGVSEERVRNLEGSMGALLDSGRKRVAALESALKEAQEERSEWQQKAELLRLKAQAGDSRAGLESQLAKVVKERDQAQADTISLQMELSSGKEKVSIIISRLDHLQFH